MRTLLLLVVFLLSGAPGTAAPAARIAKFRVVPAADSRPGPLFVTLGTAEKQVALDAYRAWLLDDGAPLVTEVVARHVVKPTGEQTFSISKLARGAVITNEPRR